ncbi:LITAF-like zinc ribbon domain-containing protein [Pelagophyceae sp. CCMP2097]|nr:LITAF-like zinc ribbon domain-containing protein [Pelagophyceae sp. CCMP2097]
MQGHVFQDQPMQGQVIQGHVLQSQIVPTNNYGAPVRYVDPQQQVYVHPKYGASPERFTCPHCHQAGTTRTSHQVGALTCLVGLGICCIFCPCTPIVCCFDGIKDVIHTCPQCNTEVGSHKRI